MAALKQLREALPIGRSREVACYWHLNVQQSLDIIQMRLLSFSSASQISAKFLIML